MSASSSASMAAAGGKDGPYIAKLFVFDLRLGTTEETDHEKILFYYPASTSIDEQMKDVGLSEGLINFTKTFSPDKPCNAFHTNKTLQAFWEAEPSVWMVLVVRRGAPAAAGGKDAAKDDREPADVCLDAVLKNAYQLVRLFNGGFGNTGSEASVGALRTTLALLLPPFIASLPPVKQLALPFSLRGIRYFPVDRQTFLSFQSFFHLAQQDFSSIAHGVCVYEDMLVWSSLPDANDTNMFYTYMVTQVLEPEAAAFSARKNRGLPVAKDPEAPPLFFPYNRIWILPLDLSPFAPHQLVSIAQKIPCVHLSSPPSSDPAAPPAASSFRLVVFRHNQLRWCFLVSVSEPLEASSFFLEHLANFVAGPIKKYERTLATLESRAHMGADEPYRYLYFNGMNLALKDTLKLGGGSKGAALSSETQALLLDMHAAFAGDRKSVV